MLRYSDAEGLSAGARTSPNLRLLEGERVTIDLTDGADADVVLLEEPAREIPQQDRLAVGRTLRLLGHLLDAAALVTPLMISSFGQNAAISVRVVLLFAVVGTVLLWPTHRRGRLVIGPSEGLVSVIARVGLAPVVTSGLLTLTRLGDLSNAGRFIDVVAIVQILVPSTGTFQ